MTLRTWLTKLQWLLGVVVVLLTTLVVPPKKAGADVYQSLNLSRAELLFKKFRVFRSSPDKIMAVNGKLVRVSMWQSANPVSILSKVIKKNINSFFQLKADADSNLGQRVELVHTNYGAAVVFAQMQADIMKTEEKPLGAFSATKTILLRPQGQGTEVIVSEYGTPTGLQAGLVKDTNLRMLRWSPDGRPPLWSTTQSANNQLRDVAIFESSSELNSGVKKGERLLKAMGFVSLDKSTSDQGIMITAKRADEIISIFFHLDNDGNFVEVIHHEF